MRWWGRALFAIGAIAIVGVALLQVSSVDGRPRFGVTTSPAEAGPWQGPGVGRLVAVSTDGCDDFNECTTGDAWRGGTCKGLPLAEGTGCASDCGTCWNAECIANPEREGRSCADGFGARTSEDVCRSLSGIAICLGEATGLARGGEPCDGVPGCVEMGSASDLGLDL